MYRHKFDAFCLCLEGGSASTKAGAPAPGDAARPKDPYEHMCDWLLEIASSLIRPDVLRPRPDGPAAAAADKATAADTCPLPVEKRFHYFMRMVRKARVWQDEDGALFRRLQVSWPAPAPCVTSASLSSSPLLSPVPQALHSLLTVPFPPPSPPLSMRPSVSTSFPFLSLSPPSPPSPPPLQVLLSLSLTPSHSLLPTPRPIPPPRTRRPNKTTNPQHNAQNNI